MLILSNGATITFVRENEVHAIFRTFEEDGTEDYHYFDRDYSEEDAAIALYPNAEIL